MPLPEEDVARVQRWVTRRNAGLPADKMRIEVEVAPRSLTLIECRAPWRPDFGPDWSRHPVARLRWTGTTGTWDLLWSTTRGFRETGMSVPQGLVGRLLVETGRNDYFWG